eukprot:scaffold96831_cov21-Tisochrysis_lutea.AAC.1
MLTLAVQRGATGAALRLRGAAHARQVSGYFNRMNTPWNPVRASTLAPLTHRASAVLCSAS